MKRRLLSLVLALAMLLGCLPQGVYASDAETVETTEITVPETTEATETTEEVVISEGLEDPDTTRWSGATAVFVGDSITYGTGTDKAYHAVIDEMGIFQSVRAMGVAGSCVSAQSDYGTGNSPLINRYTSIPDADLIVVFMGTNDYGHETPLGSISDTTDVSFYGALNVIIPGLQSKYPDSQLVFITPLHRYGFGTSKILGTGFTYDHIANGRGHTLADYVSAIKAVCGQYSVPVIDLFNQYPIDPSDSAARTAYIPDGLHPNTAGHEILAELILENLQTIPNISGGTSDDETDTQSDRLQHGNKFVSDFTGDTTRASSVVNLYLSEGQTVTFQLAGECEWALAKTDSADSTGYSRYYPNNGWNSATSYTVAEAGYYGLVLKKCDGSAFDFDNQDSDNVYDYISVSEAHTHEYTAVVTKPTCTEQGYTTYTCACGDRYVDDYTDAAGHSYQNVTCTTCGDSFVGKTVSILGDSISTYTGISNNTSCNSTIGSNTVYYTAGRYDIYQADTWWQQVIDALGMELLVNNSWSGSMVVYPRRGEGSEGYKTRCVNLHNNAGEEPDVILVFMGTNDFSYVNTDDFLGLYTLGTADAVDYETLIVDNGDGTFAYATPATTCEAYAIMLHKMKNRYPNAEVYCMNLLQRRDPDYADSYADAGQPAEFNGELAKIITRYGCTLVDLENCGIDAASDVFDLYIGDKRVHPNARGMDLMSEAVVSALLGKDTDLCDVSFDLTNVTGSGAHAVLTGNAYTVTLTEAEGFQNMTVTVTMGGEDITESCYADGVVSISAVTGDVVIAAEAMERDPLNFRWEFDGSSLASVTDDGNTANALTLTAGSVTDGVQNSARYTLEKSVRLCHDAPWVMEWKAAGDWSAMLLTSTAQSATDGMTFIFRTYNETGLLALGTYSGGSYHNYGIALADYGLDMTLEHTYRLENRIAADGSNMVYLTVDGTELGAMNNYYIGGTKNQNQTVDWVSGKDFEFGFMGSTSHPLKNMTLEYLQIWEGEHEHIYTSVVTEPTCTQQGYTTYTCACGDSYVGSYVEALSHDYLAEVIYPAGLIKGCTDYTCSRCSDSYSTLWLDETAYEGMTIACIGDSITAAYGVTKDETDYVTLLAQQLGMNYIRLGASGTTLCTDGSRTCNFSKLTESYLNGADIVTIAMGINDFCAAGEGYYELGDINSTDTSTIYGAAKMWCERIVELRKTDSLSHTQFYFATPVITSWNNSVTSGRDWDQSKTNIHGYTLRDLCNAIMEVAALYDVAVMDMNLLSGMYYVDAQDNNTAVFGGDGVHPGETGHEMMAGAWVNVLLQNNLRSDHEHTYGSWITTTWPSCVAGEQQRVCSVCSATESRALEPNGNHNYSTVVTAPTYTEQGYTTYTCANCGDSYVSDYTDPTQPRNYRWEMQDNVMVSVTTDGNTANTLMMTSGSIADGILTGVRYTLQSPVRLHHDHPWVIEWSSSGNWDGMLFGSTMDSSIQGLTYLFRYAPMNFLALGEYTGTWNNYGVIHDIDMTVSHVFRLENRVAADGSNAVYLLVDGQEIGAMHHYYVGGTNKNQTVNWANGRDIVFANIGTSSHPLKNMALEYLQIWEGEHEHIYTSVVTEPTCTQQGYTTYTCACGDSYVDDYTDAAGHHYENITCTVCGESLAGKSVSILSHSASTYDGVSNNTAYNSTIGDNDVYYTEGRHGVYWKDTWWQQTIDALGMELLVNNAWSGSCVFMPRKGEASVGYGDRAVNLHNDHTGEEPDIIFVYLGCNDFAYFKDSFGKAADVDYGALIADNGDGTFAYAEPTTTCEAYAIMLHKVEHRYPDAEIFCMTSTARRDPDYEDSYADTGQPTEYSAELHKVAAHFGYPVIDLENCIPKEAEIFDLYMGDKRAHPNALGMDQITNEVLSVMLGRDAVICHVTAEDGIVAEQAVLLGGTYYAQADLPEGYSLVVTMAGEDVTAEVYSDGMISIEAVTGDIAIQASIQREPLNFRWEIQDDALVSVGDTGNALGILAGTITDGLLDEGRYELATPVVLKHDLPWELEWKCAEDWRGTVLASDPVQQTKGMLYLTRTKGGQLCFGTWTGSQYDNYGVDLSDLDDQTHTYRLVNRVAADGSNMVWLYVDEAEIGPMNHYYIGSKDQSSTSDWVSGKDFVFSYIGMEGHALKNCKLEYLQVFEDGQSHVYEGKVISIMGDSISTFAGYIPVADGYNREHLARYPQDNLLTDVNETWWMQVVAALDAKLGINESWRGSTLSGAVPVTTGDTGENAAMSNLIRIQNMGSNGTPDVILLYGGTNDLAHVSKVGTFDSASAPTEVDLTTQKWDNLADGFVHTLLRMRHFYPDALIVALLPTYTASYYSDEKLAQGNEVMARICQHYGIPYVDLRDSGVTADHLPDGIHPGEEGMDLITEAVLELLLENRVLEPGENVVWPVAHNLTHVDASLGHYKGISQGKSFEETLDGENMTVTVTMGGQDITATCYAGGKITIAAVTGALVITAEGSYSLKDHLQQLPENYCGVNLWQVLEHDAQYYSADGWVTHTSGQVKSITFPVTPGDRLYASSFEAAVTNGGTIDGIRVTYFTEDGVLVSLTAAQVYGEFAASGYLTVPQEATAVCIPMWTDSQDWEVSFRCILDGHLQQIPEGAYNTTNLWDRMEHDPEYYSATGWAVNGSGTVTSVTFPVTAGDRIRASSFGAAVTNGNSGNGIRVTYFTQCGLLVTMSPDEVYAEFSANGYLTVPEGAAAVNVPMWKENDSELYLLTLPDQPVTSVEISWGAMEFTYMDGDWDPETHTYAEGSWRADDGSNYVTVSNTGNTTVQLNYRYENAEGFAFGGTFADEAGQITAAVELTAGSIKTVWFLLTGRPEENLTDQIAGTVTVTLE